MNGRSSALDTNIAIAINNNVAATVAWVRTLQVVYQPVPVLGELLFGAVNSANSVQN